jgi:hypothetical protein
MINFVDQNNIETGIFVKLTIPLYKTSPNDPGQETVLTYSDYHQPVSIINNDPQGNVLSTDVYLPLGDLIDITPVNNELRTSSNQVNIVISGIPLDRLQQFQISTIKGGKVDVFRALFNIQGNVAFDQTLGRFFGIINNYYLQEDFDVDTKQSSNTIVLECSSYIDVISSKVAGRRTSRSDMRKFFPNDSSFDRVTTLANNIFDFGAPR